MRLRIALLVIVLAGAILPHSSARADMAPPMAPPGSTLLPGGETTAVRMVAETVTLSVDTDPTDAQGAIARTVAVFTMRNLGGSEERMRARFPLSFPDGSSDGYFNYPEIPSISVKIDGRSVATRREMQPPYNPQPHGEVRADVPWAVFEVDFPPSTEVIVQVSYTAKGYGYYPQLMFDYVLETGAGWNGTIGSVDIIVELPYDASDLNVLMNQTSPHGPDAAPDFNKGTQVHWHYDDLEPTSGDNIQITIVAPALWRSVLKENVAVSTDPKDGEAWGRLAKAYKESARYPKGWFREDAAGPRLIELSRDAYERCLELLPKDPLWHYGYADLLWSEYYWGVRSSGQPDAEGLLPRALSELQSTLRLDPDNPQAIEMLDWIQAEVPGAVQHAESGYIFLALTATPLPPTPFEPVPSPTPAPIPTSRSESTRVPVGTPPEPHAVNPLCGAAGLAGLLLPLAAVVGRRRPNG